MHKQHSKCVVALVGVATMGLRLATAQAQSLPEFRPSPSRGFSYFLGVAQQTATYSEKPSIVDVNMAAKTRSAMLVSGALYAFNDDLMLSLDNLSTFAPAISQENWHAGDGTLLQTDRFSLSQSNTRALAYVRNRDNIFWVGGINFRSQSFKRYDFQAKSDLVEVDTAPTEESSSEIVAEVGVAIESERVKESSTHSGLRLTVGTPLWRQVTNTSYPGLTFSNNQGWDVNLEGRYSWAIAPIAHLGLWGRYGFSRRHSEVMAFGSRQAEMPTSSLRSTTVGVELLWKL